MTKKPKIFHQPEKSSHCGACASASILDWFGEEPESIPILFAQLRGEGRTYEGMTPGLWASHIQSYFLRKDWVCLINRSGGPVEKDLKGEDVHSHSQKHQQIATWRIIHQMLKDGYMCILEYSTASQTNHFAVVYDAFIKRNMYNLRLACSSQGYLEYPAEYILNETGTSQLFIKPHNNEYK